MKKHLLKLYLSTIILSCIATFIWVHILELSRDNIPRCYMPYFTEFILACIAFLMSLSFFTIFFNLYKNFRTNRVLRFLSFYFFLFIDIIIIIAMYYNYMSHFLYGLSVIIPLFIMITYSYISFSKFLQNHTNYLE